MTDFNTLDHLDVAGNRVMLRADFNVPMKDGRVTDRSRIKSVVPTIKELLEKGASIIIASHLGRPNGQVNADLSLAPLVPILAEEIGCDILFAEDCIGESALFELVRLTYIEYHELARSQTLGGFVGVDLVDSRLRICQQFSKTCHDSSKERATIKPFR